MFSWSIFSTNICTITLYVWILMWMMRNIYWFSVFMSWFLIIIIFVLVWTWLIIFSRRIIICVIFLIVCFSLWLSIIIISVVTLNWRIIFSRIIIVCVILLFVCFIFLNIFFKILNDFFWGIYYLLDDIFGLFGLRLLCKGVL